MTAPPFLLRLIASIALLVFTLTWIPAAQEQKKGPAKSGTASMTGCIDEQEGQYLLLDDRTRGPIANLEAEGFETESFAKHVGHKVTVRGTSSPGSARPIF